MNREEKRKPKTPWLTIEIKQKYIENEGSVSKRQVNKYNSVPTNCSKKQRAEIREMEEIMHINQEKSVAYFTDILRRPNDQELPETPIIIII